jgi:succinyl-CoA synthetase beta subunit
VYLLEHDAKTLLDAAGIAVPAGCLVESVAALDEVTLPPGPWVVKAQVPAGGRGKAGLVRMAESAAELPALVGSMLGKGHRGHKVASCRIESRRVAVHEAYLGFMLEPESGGVRVLATASGGVEVESSGAVQSKVVAPEPEALATAVRELAASAAEPVRGAMIAAGTRLGELFLARDAVLLEVNPLFVAVDGQWIAGDAKMVVDDNALERQPQVNALLAARSHAYVETHLKSQHGFDYVVVDPDGELGLLTTGAGLSMMLIDELRASGIRPYNFLDVRTGGLRGDASRLVKVLTWIAEGRNVKCVLVNVFAGITHLGEFSRLLVQALNEAPVLRVPVVTRLVGNGLDDARAVLGAAGIMVEPDLDKALAAVRAVLDTRAQPGAMQSS